MTIKVISLFSKNVVMQTKEFNGETRYSANDGATWRKTPISAYQSARRLGNLVIANRAFAVPGGQRMYGWK